MKKKTLNKGSQDNNFDLLRSLAAFFVVISHSFGILNKGLQQPALWYNNKHIILSDVGLYIFFTISGYLVTQSLFNSDSLTHYLWKRLLRIMPALIIVNIACVIMGGYVTSFSLKEYFLNKDTWTYFIKNSTLVVNQFTLPGVFTNLDDKSVNASLWTILIEVKCYVVLLFGAYNIVTRKWLFLSCFILFEALRVYMTEMHIIKMRGLDIEADFLYGTYFYLGSLFYCFKDDIPFKWFYANILMAIAFLTVYTVLEPITLAVFLAYCIIIIGTNRSVINLKGFDISYGLYLYAFPVQQLVLLYLSYSVNVWLHITVSTAIASMLAFLSWIYVEKPFLKQKNRFNFR